MNCTDHKLATLGKGLLSALIWCLLLNALRTFSSSFEVTGEVILVAYPEGREVSQHSNAFTATISDCSSRIVAGGMHPDFQYFEYGTHSGYSYMFDRYRDGELSWWKKARENNAPPKARKPSSNNSTMELWPTLVPLPMKGYITPVWIAYSSSCYFTNEKGGLIDCPFYQANFMQGGIPQSRTAWPKVPAEWKFLTANPKLLDSLVVFFDPMSSVFPAKGMRVTNAVYQVESWTKCGKQTIPKTFSVTIYRLDPKFSNNRLISVEARISGVATEFRELPKADEFGLPLTTKTHIADYRFGDVIGTGAAFNYLAKEGKIRTLEELQNDEEIRRVYFDRPRVTTNRDRP